MAWVYLGRLRYDGVFGMGGPPNLGARCNTALVFASDRTAKRRPVPVNLGFVDIYYDSHRLDSNQRPAVYKTAALPTELRWQ